MRIPVKAGANLQSAIDAANAGDVIEVEAGATFPSVSLPEKGGPVLLTTDQPLPDRRLIHADAGLPTLQSDSVEPSLIMDGAAHWVIQGIRVGPTKDGMYNAVRMQGARNIELNQIYFEGGPQGQRRAIMANGRGITVQRSYIANVWRDGEESQAIAAWDGSGPFTIRDNFLEAAAECILFGGAESASVDNIPADILVEGNHLSKRDAWRGQPRVVKNLLELKSAKRVVIRKNLMERNWTQAQSGFSILFTVNDDSAPWCAVEDVLFEDNDVLDIERGVNILGHGYAGPTGRATRIAVVRNRFRILNGPAFQIGGEAGDVSITDNTVEMPADGVLLMLYGGDVWETAASGPRPALYAVDRLTFSGNVCPATQIVGDGTAPGQAAIDKYVRVFNGSQPAPTPPQPPPPPVPVPTPDPEVEALKAELAAMIAELALTTAQVTKLRSGLASAPATTSAKTLANYLRSIGR